MNRCEECQEPIDIDRDTNLCIKCHALKVMERNPEVFKRLAEL